MEPLKPVKTFNFEINLKTFIFSWEPVKTFILHLKPLFFGGKIWTVYNTTNQKVSTIKRDEIYYF